MTDRRKSKCNGPETVQIAYWRTSSVSRVVSTNIRMEGFAIRMPRARSYLVDYVKSFGFFKKSVITFWDNFLI